MRAVTAQWRRCAPNRAIPQRRTHEGDVCATSATMRSKVRTTSFVSTLDRPPSAHLIDLAKGYPDPALLPRDALSELCKQAARDFDEGADRGLAYGNPHAGSPLFLQELAAFISRQCPKEKSPRADGLLVTTGVSHALDMVCGALAEPGDAILVESPTYFLALGIFQSRRLEVIPVPTDELGLCVDEIDAILDARAPGSPPVKLLYTIPISHNPTGACLPAGRRKALVDLARKRDFKILADEAYHLLDWHHLREKGARPPRMACFDEAYSDTALQYLEPVALSISSFTKIVAPGLRIGWIEAAPQLVERVGSTGYVVSGGCVAAFTTDAILLHGLRSQTIDIVLQRFVGEYSARAEVLVETLREVGLRASVEPTGGFFAWVPLEVDANATLEVAKTRYGVHFMVGERCKTTDANRYSNFVRLCFAFMPLEKIREGVRGLAQAVEDVKRSQLKASL